MEKELDVLLVEGKDKEGFLLKFTLRGESVAELKKKLQEVKTLWFEDLTPYVSSFDKKPLQSSSTSKPSASSEDLGVCRKCGAPNKKSFKSGKTYCGAKCWLQGGEYGQA